MEGEGGGGSGEMRNVGDWGRVVGKRKIKWLGDEMRDTRSQRVSRELETRDD